MRRVSKAGTLWVALLGLGCLGLAGVIYLQLKGPWRPALNLAQPKEGAENLLKTEALPRPSELKVPALKEYAQVVRRTLFREERRPAPPPEREDSKAQAAAPPPPPVVAPELTLVGVIITPDARLALLRPAKGGELERFTAGTKIEGWVLASVEPERVELTQGNERHVIELTRNLPKAKVPAPRGRRDNPRKEAGTDAARSGDGRDGRQRPGPGVTAGPGRPGVSAGPGASGVSAGPGASGVSAGPGGSGISAGPARPRVTAGPARRDNRR